MTAIKLEVKINKSFELDLDVDEVISEFNDIAPVLERINLASNIINNISDEDIEKLSIDQRIIAAKYYERQYFRFKIRSIF